MSLTLKLQVQFPFSIKVLRVILNDKKIEHYDQREPVFSLNNLLFLLSKVIYCMSYDPNFSNQQSLYDSESTRLEIVTTCVGFDDILDATLSKNHAHADTYIVVTTDRKSVV